MSDDRPRVCSVCRDTHKMTLHYDNGDELEHYAGIKRS